METTTRISRGSIGVAILRVALGLTTLFTWFDNVDKKFYDGATYPATSTGCRNRQREGGNGSSPWIRALDHRKHVAAGAPSSSGGVLTFFELFIGIGLVFGVFTRGRESCRDWVLFVSLFLVYFGGEEWIWTYVLLAAAAIAVFQDWGGRKFGVDEFIAKTKGESPGTVVW